MKKQHAKTASRLPAPENEVIVRQLIDKLTMFSVVFGAFALAGSLSRVFNTGLKADIIADLATYVVMLVILVLRRFIPVMAVAALFLGTLGINSIITIKFTGMLTSGMILTCACCVVAGSIFGFRVGVGSLITATLALIVFAVLYYCNVWSLPFDLDDYQRSPFSWISFITGFFVFTLACLTAVNFLLVKLRDALTELHVRSDEKLLLEKQLRHAEKLEVIGQLAGGVAHDFNNQLAGILGFAELIKTQCSPDSETYANAHSIALIARRSADLTSKLLAFARKGTSHAQVFDLHAIIAEVIAILSRSIDRTIVITNHADAVSSSIKGDAAQIQNALLNIALNARDAMGKGGTLDFSTVNREITEGFSTPYHQNVTPGNYIHVTISDTGTGISAEAKKHLFEPFFTTKDPGKGTGMGLATVYGTIQSHHGMIDVDSTVGKGTSFHVYLPLSNEEPRKTDPDTSIEYTQGSGNVLVIEDEKNVGKMLVMMLKQLGYKASLATNGNHAMELYTGGEQYDAVILDMILPDTNGRILLEQLRSIDPYVKIIICSGYAADCNIAELLETSGTLFLHKPFTMNELSRQLHTITRPD